MNRIMRLFIVCCIFFFSACCSCDANTGVETRFRDMTNFYEKGDYGRAVDVGEWLVNDGYMGGSLFFALGNAYLKQNNLGKALLNYRRACFFIPRDGALLANLGYAKGLMKQRELTPKRYFALEWIMRFGNALSMKESFLLFNFAYSFTVFLILLAFFKRRFRFLLALLVCVSLVVSVAFALPYIDKYVSLSNVAVITAPIVDARFEPSMDDDTPSHYPLYEGMRVRVLNSIRGWYKVKRPDGKIGWVPENAAERLFP